MHIVGMAMTKVNVSADRVRMSQRYLGLLLPSLTSDTGGAGTENSWGERVVGRQGDGGRGGQGGNLPLCDCLQHVVSRQEKHLGLFQVIAGWRPELAGTSCQKKVRLAAPLVAVDVERAEETPFCRRIAGLFEEFAPGSINGFFALLKVTGGQVEDNPARGVLVVPLGNHQAFFGYREYDHVLPHLHLVEIIHHAAIRELDSLHGHPEVAWLCQQFTFSKSVPCLDVPT